ncbi:MAG: hypothetical protein PHS57_05920 [Alphaproteobacteria bacterium]|nr:hypothetical protein [Alphaproteobacteria bacterium]
MSEFARAFQDGARACISVAGFVVMGIGILAIPALVIAILESIKRIKEDK